MKINIYQLLRFKKIGHEMSDLMAVEKVKVISFQGWGGGKEPNPRDGCGPTFTAVPLSWNVWEARDTWSD